MMRAVLVAIVVFAVVWLCAIGIWRGTGATPGGLQMALVLGGLPLVVLAGMHVARRASRSRVDTGADAPAKAADGAGGGGVATPPSMALGAGAVWLPVADTPTDALAALAQPPRPGLHPTLRDRDGLPVFAAFVAHLDTFPAEDLLQRHAPGLRASDEALRALALLEPVADALFIRAASLLPRPAQTEGQVIAGMHHRGAAGPCERVDVHLLLPASWPAALREACVLAMRGQAIACGLQDAQLDVHAVPVADARASWARMRQLLDAAGTPEGREPSPRWQVLLAADSRVGAQSIRRLESTGVLMGTRQQDGVVPAEGAAGVLLQPASASGDAMALVHAPVDGETSLASLRAGARATADLLERAMRDASIEPALIGLVLSDADQRAAPSVETAAAVSLACPDLDVARQCPALGVANGALGIVAPVALLALAEAQARESAQPLLVLSLLDERQRVALAIVPAEADGSSSRAGADTPATVA